MILKEHAILIMYLAFANDVVHQSEYKITLSDIERLSHTTEKYKKIAITIRLRRSSFCSLIEFCPR